MHVRILIAATLALAGTQAHADIYKCRNAAGKVVFSDAPCSTEHTLVDQKASTTAAYSAKASRTTAPHDEPAVLPAASTAALSQDAEADAKACEYARNRHSAVKARNCIEGVQPGTGKRGCLAEPQRSDYIASIKDAADRACAKTAH